MDTIRIGKYIAEKRKSLGMTQEDLAAKLGVTNKAVSKWENGKCLPDVGLHEALCATLQITLNELMAGKDIEHEELLSASEKTLHEVLKRNTQLMAWKDIVIGIVLILLGRVIPMPNYGDGAGDAMKFIEGVSIGLGIGVTLLGIAWLVYGAVNFQKKL